jgi:hypothetical protein
MLHSIQKLTRAAGVRHLRLGVDHFNSSTDAGSISAA